MIEVDGPPARWVVRGGRPAEAIWRAYDGLPSYESGTDGRILVYDLLLANESTRASQIHNLGVADRQTMFIPRDYGMDAVRSAFVGDHELVALHDDPAASWTWRPLLYRLNHRDLLRLGSQMELEWRWGLAEVYQAQADVQDVIANLANDCAEQGLPYEDFEELARPIIDGFNARDWVSPRSQANRRADAILREHLNPQQRLDLAALGHFHVRGTINRLYRVEPDNGAAIVHPETREVVASMCLHPERWMPASDVALAIKLAIESGPDGEQEMLDGARTTLRARRKRPGPLERAAWDRERDLLPSPIGTA